MDTQEPVFFDSDVDVYTFWQLNGRFPQNRDGATRWYKRTPDNEWGEFLFFFSEGISRAKAWLWLSNLGYRPFLNHPENPDGWYAWNKGGERWVYKFSFEDGYNLWKDKDKEVPF